MPFSTDHEKATKNIARVLGSFSKQPTDFNAVQIITIVVFTGTAQRAERFVDACEQFDTILSSGEEWPLLKRVIVEAQVVGRYQDQAEAIKILRTLPDCLPHLSESKILEYQIHDSGP